MAQSAFPYHVYWQEKGMSLRDYFAAQSLPGVMSVCCGDHRLGNETMEQLFARKAYQLADAMMAHRTKHSGNS